MAVTMVASLPDSYRTLKADETAAGFCAEVDRLRRPQASAASAPRIFQLLSKCLREKHHDQKLSQSFL
jgi:hypothetical protein